MTISIQLPTPIQRGPIRTIRTISTTNRAGRDTTKVAKDGGVLFGDGVGGCGGESVIDPGAIWPPSKLDPSLGPSNVKSGGGCGEIGWQMCWETQKLRSA